jgi:hypothetical protein
VDDEQEVMAVSADERKEREDGDEERPADVETPPADEESDVEAHGGWGGAGRPEP